MSRGRKERLGRGLGALLGEYLEEERVAAPGDVRQLPVASILPNPFQPRREFRKEELEELTRSIEENGLLQPLVVRPAGKDRYELVAGERRLRAVTELGWTEVPAVTREVDDRTLLVLALVENLQREALGPLEEAEGYRVLAESFGLTQGEIAEVVGKDRSTVANTLRLLKLPPSIRKLVEEGALSAGHARALLAVPDPSRARELARKAVRQGWSVRQLEERIQRLRTPRTDRRGEAKRRARNPVVEALEEELRTVLGTRVVIRAGARGKGVIEVPFHGPEDFERIFALLAGREASEVVD